jgi:SAM-dependent methyltransferase
MPPTARALDCYKDLCTQFYDLDKPEPPREAIEFYWRRYQQAGGPALEAMCGSGRFLIPFALRGGDIDGVDASPRMLEACRRKAAAAGLAVALFEQFLQALDTPRRYRYVFIPGGSFVLIPPDEQLDALRALARHLLPGGELVFDVAFPGETLDGPSNGGGERSVVRPDGARIVLSWEEDGRMRYDLVADGAVLASELETFDIHPVTRAELEPMLRAAGFADIRALADFDEAEAAPDAASAVFVCRKPAA